MRLSSSSEEIASARISRSVSSASVFMASTFVATCLGFQPPMRGFAPLSSSPFSNSSSYRLYDSHHFFRIARAGCDVPRHELIQTCKIVGRELNLQRGDVLLEVFAPLGSWDRHDVVAFRQHPGERELCGLAVLFLRHGLDARHELQVLRKVVALETRAGTAVVIGREIVLGDLSGEKPTAERAIGHEADTKLSARRNDFVLGVAG